MKHDIFFITVYATISLFELSDQCLPLESCRAVTTGFIRVTHACHLFLSSYHIYVLYNSDRCSLSIARVFLANQVLGGLDIW